VTGLGSPGAGGVNAEHRIEDLLRELAPQVLGTLVRRHGQFDACEDAVQEALVAAALQWPAEGVPDRPRSWLLTVAGRSLVDHWHAEQEWDAALRGNLTVTFLTLKCFLPGMVERGHGSIVTMASTAARLASGDPIGAPTGYAVAKAGVVRLTQEVAKEVARHGVRVNCVSPSTILTERLQTMIPAERRAQMTAMHPLGRLGTPEDVACAVLFLASECASWITGVTLDIAGGQIMT